MHLGKSIVTVLLCMLPYIITNKRNLIIDAFIIS